ncbi:6-phosphofructokinase [Capsaspora owczarzaki ATCC 30864]|uniref:6-phosphofructokinase n=1 Tax=Capsaspora owczarzaki (strain ATCC 30864) TaxID=595528 RepID=A0A0D2VRM0_CAPO3|nr:6-phosphofructokinase [Capsaspora owczarzaki ATCC 30864]KJE93532.1 6-phosphofructokinase [Capsaspora owczarzaki ATCC 30864]|eukprot:XP_011270399.1 6-phosphofructokinase [Capsaspora owczarzaki ATCC 30864]
MPLLSQDAEWDDMYKRLPEPPAGTARRAFAVLTSGGDSQGMNAAVRAIVRVALYNYCDAYAIYEGYVGLVNGGSFIKKMGWGDVSGILSQGGTVIGTARCAEFRDYPGRLKAALNLLERGINNLIVIGGDGSLTGADLFKREWPQYLKDLLQQKAISEELAQRLSYINIVGLVGSIDNDLCGTDNTIGADTALKRIVESIDSISSTAASHQRSFVLEVMGRNCGYLALMAAIASGADWTFIPEQPHGDDWRVAMCDELKRNRERGRRMSLVIMAEGARDRSGTPITAEQVKQAIDSTLHHDTRITVLGHVQRGGAPTVYDRVLGTVCGARAVQYLLHNAGQVRPVVMGVSGSKYITIPLMESIALTQSVPVAIKSKEFARAVELRGPGFVSDVCLLHQLNSADPTHRHVGTRPFKIAIACVGAPASGMNSAIRAAVLAAVDSLHTVIGYHDGFDGIAKGEFEELTWLSVSQLADKGGCVLGTNRSAPNIGQVATSLQKHAVDALILIGGFEAYTGALALVRARSANPALRIPILCLPATISNNVPGTEMSVGSDTALNAIVTCIDTIKQSATSSRARVFVIETHGGNCGYLPVTSALAAGAERAYTPEEGISLSTLVTDLQHFQRRFSEGANCAVIVRGEKASSTYTTPVIEAILGEESRQLFTCRSNVLGHLQQGFTPSPIDRISSVKFAVQCVTTIVSECNRALDATTNTVQVAGSEAAFMVGLKGVGITLTPLEELVEHSDFKLRVPKAQLWTEANLLLHVLGKYDYYNDAKTQAQ